MSIKRNFPTMRASCNGAQNPAMIQSVLNPNNVERNNVMFISGLLFFMPFLTSIEKEVQIKVAQSAILIRI